MNNLTAEQIRKIEENKRIALQKRNALHNVAPTSATVLPQQSTSWQTKQFPKKAQHLLPAKKGAGVMKVETATFKLLSSCKFVVDMPFHQPSIDIMKTITGRVFGKFHSRFLKQR